MIKCPYCGKEFDETGKPKIKWYFSTYWVVIGLLCAGPFALPLIWFNPRCKPATKWIVSIVVMIVTIWLTIKSIELMQTMRQQLQRINAEMGGSF
ncbi:MAG: hypothetical protein CVV39_08020 [Planctomycetes bacterium HGW-Planctomycetes-1]|nr:MAG: hypothetical protein CVV39_08020 [Planctomycetes bacterium HGW-Planctomycetes-1]